MKLHMNFQSLLSLISFCLFLCENQAIKRTYFIGIREELWDYAPGGYNNINGRPASQDEYVLLY